MNNEPGLPTHSDKNSDHASMLCVRACIRARVCAAKPSEHRECHNFQSIGRFFVCFHVKLQQNAVYMSITNLD